MAAFIYPPPTYEPLPWCGVEEARLLRGMAHLALYLRVGMVKMVPTAWPRPRGHVLGLTMGEELWTEDRGWRVNARNILAGKRQIGSQRFPILDELAAMGRAP